MMVVAVTMMMMMVIVTNEMKTVYENYNENVSEVKDQEDDT